MGFIDDLYEDEPGSKKDEERRRKAAEEKGRKSSVRHAENILTEKSLGIERGKKGFSKVDTTTIKAPEGELSKGDKDNMLKRALKGLASHMGYNPQEKNDEELEAIYKQGDKTNKRWKEARDYWAWKRSQK